MRHILVVEQDAEARQSIQLALRAAGYATDGVATAAEAERALEAGAFDAVLVGTGATRSLVASLRAAEGRAAATPPPTPRLAPASLVGDSPAMRALKAVVARVAPQKVTVLVRGESGTGKEVVARSLHDLSGRASAPFVAVNCGAIPPGLLESELFGHRKGAFTDAVRDRLGLVEQAAGGTLFLDEIAELPPSLQVKLLRVLQDSSVRRLGDETDVTVDVRVVAATARPLEAEVAAGRFRQISSTGWT